MRLKPRVEALEARTNVSALKHWHRILRYEGQNEAEAVAAYEAEHGPVGPDDGTVLRVIISKPFPAPEMAP